LKGLKGLKRLKGDIYSSTALPSADRFNLNSRIHEYKTFTSTALPSADRFNLNSRIHEYKTFTSTPSTI